MMMMIMIQKVGYYIALDSKRSNIDAYSDIVLLHFPEKDVKAILFLFAFKHFFLLIHPFPYNKDF